MLKKKEKNRREERKESGLWNPAGPSERWAGGEEKRSAGEEEKREEGFEICFFHFFFSTHSKQNKSN
jgi:hypothetical protein